MYKSCSWENLPSEEWIQQRDHSAAATFQMPFVRIFKPGLWKRSISSELFGAASHLLIDAWLHKEGLSDQCRAVNGTKEISAKALGFEQVLQSQVQQYGLHHLMLTEDLVREL